MTLAEDARKTRFVKGNLKSKKKRNNTTKAISRIKEMGGAEKFPLFREYKRYLVLTKGKEIYRCMYL